MGDGAAPPLRQDGKAGVACGQDVSVSDSSRSAGQKRRVIPVRFRYIWPQGANFSTNRHLVTERSNVRPRQAMNGSMCPRRFMENRDSLQQLGLPWPIGSTGHQCAPINSEALPFDRLRHADAGPLATARLEGIRIHAGSSALFDSPRGHASTKRARSISLYVEPLDSDGWRLPTYAAISLIVQTPGEPAKQSL